MQLAIPPGPDAEASAAAFYGGLLGLEPVPKPEPLASRGGCWFRRDAVEVHLGVEDPFRPARKAHPAFVVDDLEGLLTRLDAAGVPARRDTKLPGVERAHVDDPFGNRLELIQS